MKNFYIFIILTLTVACNNVTILSPSMEDVVLNFIDENPQDSIYSLVFYHENNHDFVTIQGMYDTYHSDYIDGCFELNSKIITYCSLNNTPYENFINTHTNIDATDKLRKFTDIKDPDLNIIDDRMPHSKTFRLLSDGSIAEATNKDFINTNCAKSSNCIKGQELNNYLNQYINNNKELITYLRFQTLDNKQYLCIGSDNVVDMKNCIGVFHRDSFLVVIYADGESNIANDFFDKTELEPLSILNEYRDIHSVYPLHEEEYYVYGNSEFKEVHEEGIRMNLMFHVTDI